jgi:flavin reductase (DIM6/NTAB) family NADH-FMN oxidoreductase RutF
MTTALKTDPAQATAPAVTTHGNVAAHDRLPLAVLAAEVSGRMMCVVIESFFDESLAPGLVSVRIPVDHPDWAELRTAPVLGISVLNPLQTLAAGSFSGSHSVQRGLLADSTGSGRLVNAEAHLTTRLYQEFDSGDYTVALLHVTSRENGPVSAPGRRSTASPERRPGTTFGSAA